jgi:hypothetical protein
MVMGMAILDYVVMMKPMNVPASAWALLASTLCWLPAADLAPRFRTLTEGATTITVAEPDGGYYRSTRFVWGGMVTQFKVGEHTLYTELKRPHDPARHDGAAGGAEEFGIDGGLGYDDAKIGEPFVKLGVGTLTRVSDKKYFFGEPYPVVAMAPWTVSEAPGALIYRQEFTSSPKWAWLYTVTVRVQADGYTLERELTNRGSAQITTDHYNHHMIARNDQPIDGTWSLRFAWPAIANRPLPSYHMADGLLTLTGPLDRTLWTDFRWDTAPTTTAMTLTHGGSKTALTITTDAPPAKVALYGEKTAICPEPFTAIDVAPAATFRWNTTYQVRSAP